HLTLGVRSPALPTVRIDSGASRRSAQGGHCVNIRSRRIARLVALVVALALVAAACGDDDSTEGSEGSGNGTSSTTGGGAAGGDEGSALSGTLVGAGASSQAAAMQGWQAGFQNRYGDVTVEYDPIGSGGGRDTFLS